MWLTVVMLRLLMKNCSNPNELLWIVTQQLVKEYNVVKNDIGESCNCFNTGYKKGCMQWCLLSTEGWCCSSLTVLLMNRDTISTIKSTRHMNAHAKHMHWTLWQTPSLDTAITHIFIKMQYLWYKHCKQTIFVQTLKQYSGFVNITVINSYATLIKSLNIT